jgi:hypothetical protein
MTTARSFVRLAICGFFVNVLAFACTVEEASDPCTPGETQKCDCKDGSESTQVCRDDGERFGACDCSDDGAGGANQGNGGATSTGGVEDQPGAGNGGEPSSSSGGAGGAGGDAAGVNGGATSMAGAGGSGEDLGPIECQLPDEPTLCEICYFGGCCDQWAPCVNDDECLQQFSEVLDCTNTIRASRNVTTADLEDCAQTVGETNGSWSAALSGLTVDMVDCVAGEPGWEGSPWGNLACKAECFDKE